MQKNYQKKKCRTAIRVLRQTQAGTWPASGRIPKKLNQASTSVHAFWLLNGAVTKRAMNIVVLDLR